MLTRLYIDNYRCFVNFEFRPKPKQLILGVNGTGKSELLKVLGALRDFIVQDHKVHQLFTPETRTRWQTVTRQAFELEVSGNAGRYVYRLSVDVPDKPARSRVVKEVLECDGKPLVQFVDEQVSVFDDNYSQTANYPFESDRSALSVLGPRKSGTRLRWFKEWLDHLFCVGINPTLMGTEARVEDVYPEDDLSNFAAWYSHLIQEHPGIVEELRKSLREILNGFDSLSLRLVGRTARVLRATFSWAERRTPVEFDFDELSDGQRALIALYALLHFAAGDGNTVCFDEPDNFIALAEIQPWLFELGDRIEDHGGQAILISHHPELINILAPKNAVIFSREHGGPVRVEPFRSDALDKLTPAEQVARGWERA